MPNSNTNDPNNLNPNQLLDFFALRKDDSVRQLPITPDIREKLEHFREETNRLKELEGRDFSLYSKGYKLDKNEIWRLECPLNPSCRQAINNPEEIDPFAVPGDLARMKCVFTGWEDDNGHLHIAFQLIEKNQYLQRAEGVGMLFFRNTFDLQENDGIVISEKITAYYLNGNLFFKSFQGAHRIFDLSAYCRDATEQDLEDFVNCRNIHVEDEGKFRENVDLWTGRKIATMNDANVFDNLVIDDVKNQAERFDIDVRFTTAGNQILVTKSKSYLKTILKFLDEDCFEGIFSRRRYTSNSKRTLG